MTRLFVHCIGLVLTVTFARLVISASVTNEEPTQDSLNKVVSVNKEITKVVYHGPIRTLPSRASLNNEISVIKEITKDVVKISADAVETFQSKYGNDTAVLYAKIADKVVERAELQDTQLKVISEEIEELEKLDDDKKNEKVEERLEKLKMEQIELGKKVAADAAKARNYQGVAIDRAIKHNSTALNVEKLKKKQEKANELVEAKTEEVRKSVKDIEQRTEERLKKLPEDSKEAKRLKEKVAKLEKEKAEMIDTEKDVLAFKLVQKEKEEEERKNKKAMNGDNGNGEEDKNGKKKKKQKKSDDDDDKEDVEEKEKLRKRMRELEKEKKTAIEKKEKLVKEVKVWNEKHADGSDEADGDKKNGKKEKDEDKKEKGKKDKNSDKSKSKSKNDRSSEENKKKVSSKNGENLPQSEEEWLELKAKAQEAIRKALNASPKSTQRRDIVTGVLQMNDDLTVTLAGHIDRLLDSAQEMAEHNLAPKKSQIQKRSAPRIRRRSRKSKKAKKVAKTDAEDEQDAKHNKATDEVDDRRKKHKYDEYLEDEYDGYDLSWDYADDVFHQGSEVDDHSYNKKKHNNKDDNDDDASASGSDGSDDDDDGDEDSESDSNEDDSDDSDDDKSKDDDNQSFEEIRHTIQSELYPELKYLLNEKSFLSGLALEGLNRSAESFGITTVNKLVKCFHKCRSLLTKDAKMEAGIAKLIAHRVTGSPSAIEQRDWKNFTTAALDRKRLAMYALAYEAGIYNQLANKTVLKIIPEAVRIQLNHLARNAEKALTSSAKKYKQTAALLERQASDFFANDAATRHFVDVELGSRHVAKTIELTVGELEALIHKEAKGWVPDIGGLMGAANSKKGLDWRKFQNAMRD